MTDDATPQSPAIPTPLPSKAPVPMYQPKSCNGTRLLKPRRKPRELWTEEERRAYDAYISDLHSRTGRNGGYAAHRTKRERPPLASGVQMVALGCRKEDHKVIMDYVRRRRISIPMFMHEVAQRICAETRTAPPPQA